MTEDKQGAASAASATDRSVAVAIWNNKPAVPYPVQISFTPDAGGAAALFLLTVEQARQLARDMERTCRRIRKLYPLKGAR